MLPAAGAACCLRNVLREEGEVCRIATKLGTVRATGWGHHFDVKTQQSHDNDVLGEDVAYTNLAIDLHMDNVYRDPVPGYWCLLCIDQGGGDGTSGLSMLRDAFFAAELLREEDPAAFHVLTQVPKRGTPASDSRLRPC